MASVKVIHGSARLLSPCTRAFPLTPHRAFNKMPANERVHFLMETMGSFQRVASMVRRCLSRVERKAVARRISPWSLLGTAK